MGASVKLVFDGRFVLDEERIRKINELLKIRSDSSKGGFTYEYHIFRKDDYYYTTSDIDDIFKEDNAKHNRITELHIKSKKESDLDLFLAFENEGSALGLSGENRDFVYLLASDLKDYINNEVNVRRNIKLFTVREYRFILNMVLSTLFICLPLAALIYYILSYIPPGYEEALKSDDILTKIDYLIKYKSSIKNSAGIILLIPLLIVGPFVAMFIPSMINRIYRYIFPGNIYLIGKMISEHEKRLKYRDKIIWSIIISLGITIIGGIIVYTIISPII